MLLISINVGSPIKKTCRWDKHTISHRKKTSKHSDQFMAANPTSSPPKKPTPKKKNKTTKKPTPPPPASPIQTESTHPQTPEKTQLNQTPSKRTKSPGFRVIGNRIYDSKNGKTCHQVLNIITHFHDSCNVCVFWLI